MKLFKMATGGRVGLKGERGLGEAVQSYPSCCSEHLCPCGIKDGFDDCWTFHVSGIGNIAIPFEPTHLTAHPCLSFLNQSTVVEREATGSHYTFKKGDLFIETTPTQSDREMVPCDKQLRECMSVNKLKGQQLVVCVCVRLMYYY